MTISKFGKLRFAFAVLAIGLMALVVSACGGSSSSSSSGESTESSESSSGGGEAEETGGETEETASSENALEGKKVFLINCTPNVPYCARDTEIIEEELSAKGAKVTALLDEFSAAEEAAHLNQAISQQADIILYVANAQEAAHAPLVKAQQENIPVVLVGTAPGPSIEGLYTTYSGPSDYKSGELQAEMLNEGLEKAGVKEGKIALVLGASGTLPEQERLEGWNKAIAKTPQWEVVAEPEGAWDPVKAGQATAPVFGKFGKELVGVSSMSGSMAAATVKSAENAGLHPGTGKGDLVVAGLNCDGTSIEAIEAGTLYATTSQGPVSEAETAIKVTEEILAGKEVPEKVEIANEPIYKSNVSEFAKECTY